MVSAQSLSLKGRVLRLLSQREHSRTELARKLARLETEDGDLAKVLDDFVAKGLISEERLAQSVVNQRAPKLGAMRLRAELQTKGVDPSHIQSVIAELKPTEAARAKAVWARKFNQAPADAKAMAKQVRFLAARGFDSAAIRAAVPPICRVSLSEDGVQAPQSVDDYLDNGE